MYSYILSAHWFCNDPEADGYELKGLINEANFDWQSPVVWLLPSICKQIGTKLLIADLYGHYGDDMVSIKIGPNIRVDRMAILEKIQTQRFWQRFNALWTQNK